MQKLAALVLLVAAAARGAEVPGAAQLQRMAARLTPTPLHVDLSRLSAGDRRAAGKLIAASRIVNDIFLDQMWSGNRALWRRLEADPSPLGRARAHYFWLNKAPWSEIDGYPAFLPAVPPKKLPEA